MKKFKETFAYIAAYEDAMDMYSNLEGASIAKTSRHLDISTHKVCQKVFSNRLSVEDYEGCQGMIDAAADFDPSLVSIPSKLTPKNDIYTSTGKEVLFEKRVDAIEDMEDAGLISREEADEKIDDLMDEFGENEEDPDNTDDDDEPKF